jgi:hypothetical protein
MKCFRCGSLMFSFSDMFGSYKSCMTCGHHENPYIPPQTVPQHMKNRQPIPRRKKRAKLL